MTWDDMKGHMGVLVDNTEGHCSMLDAMSETKVR